MCTGANVNLASLRGNTPLRAAVLSGDSECIAMMLALNPTLESATGTALAAAAQLGDCETLNVLVAAGADIAHESRDGVTALIAAVIADQHQAIKLLLSLGADPTATSKDGVSAVDIAQKRNLPVAYSLLLQVCSKPCLYYHLHRSVYTGALSAERFYVHSVQLGGPWLRPAPCG